MNAPPFQLPMQQYCNCPMCPPQYQQKINQTQQSSQFRHHPAQPNQIQRCSHPHYGNTYSWSPYEEYSPITPSLGDYHPPPLLYLKPPPNPYTPMHVPMETSNTCTSPKWTKKDDSLTDLFFEFHWDHQGSEDESDEKNDQIPMHSYVMEAHFSNNILSVSVMDTIQKTEFRNEFIQTDFVNDSILKIAVILVDAINSVNDAETNSNNDLLSVVEYGNWCYVTVNATDIPSFALRPTCRL
eukprot:411446_1